MSFSVESSDLEAYGKQVGRAAEDAHSIKGYTGKYGKELEDSTITQGLLLSALELHKGAMADGEKALARVHTLLSASSKELARSSAYYRETDRVQAEHLDRTYPGVQRSARSENGAQSFSDSADATSALKPPATPEEFSHGPISDSISTLSDWLSPSYWSLEAVKFVFQAEQDPLEQVLSWFTGDWESYVQCGEMWANAGAGVQGVSANLMSGNATLDQTWHGNAADVAYAYFDHLAQEIKSLGDAMVELKTYYTEVGLAVYETLNLIKGLLTAMADSLILIEVEVAAGTLLAETGVGPVVGYSLAALEVVKVIRLWNQVTEVYSSAEQSVKVSVAAAAAVSGGFGIALERIPAPGENYDHPAV